MYVLDNEKATAQRKNHKSNSDIKAELLSELDSLLRNANPYAKVYKMMYEVDTRSLTLARLYFDDETICIIFKYVYYIDVLRL